MPDSVTSRASNKSLAARNQLVTDHLNLVSAVARYVAGTLPSHVDFEDLVQAGTFGLIGAADRFDRDKGIAFPAYARHRIRGAILDDLRAQDWASRELRLRERRLAQAERELTATLKCTPSEEELAAHLDVSLERVRQTRQRSALCRPRSADSSDETLEPQSWSKQIAGRESDRPDVMAARSQTAEVLRGAVDLLPPRYRALITMYYQGELTMKEVGTRLGINESRVSQIHRVAVARLTDIFVSRGLSAEMLSEVV